MICKKKKLSSQFSNIRRTPFHQSSPVQAVSDFRGGSTSVTEEDGRMNKQSNKQTKEILVSNLEFFAFDITKSLQYCNDILPSNINYTKGKQFLLVFSIGFPVVLYFPGIVCSSKKLHRYKIISNEALMQRPIILNFPCNHG